MDNQRRGAEKPSFFVMQASLVIFTRLFSFFEGFRLSPSAFIKMGTTLAITHR